MILLTPGSVSATSGTVTIGANGTIEFTNAYGVSVNDVFTEDIRQYLIICSYLMVSSAAGQTIQFRFRSSGTDYSGATYYNQGAWISGSSITDYSNSTDTAAFIGNHAGAFAPNVWVADIADPMFSGGKNATMFSRSVRGGSSPETHWWGSGVNENTQFDGFTYNSSNIRQQTGKMSIYGIMS